LLACGLEGSQLGGILARLLPIRRLAWCPSVQSAVEMPPSRTPECCHKVLEGGRI
jgi:hypothetical protein